MSVFRVGSNKSSVNNFPSVRPTLDLDFANSKTLDPRITFTRSSGGYYVGADGLIKYAGVNEARFDHDPVTGESLGFLVEESRSNLLLRSEEFDNASWDKQNSHPVTANSVSAPDGTLTADTFTRTALNQFVFQSVTGTGTYTLSAWVRSANPSGSFVMQPFNPTDGIPGVTTFTATNIWQRFSITSTVTTNSGWYPCIPSNINETFYVWGAQLELGSFPTSYIPTEGSTRTRAADSASITGKNFSDFYNSSEGSVRAKFKFYANHGPYCEAVSIAGVGSGFMVIDVAGGLVTDCYGANTVVTGGDNARTKFITGVRAYKFSTNDSVIGCSGASSITIQTGTKTNPNTTALWLGRRGDGGTAFGSMNGHIQNVSYYPKRLSNAQLQALTK